MRLVSLRESLIVLLALTICAVCALAQSGNGSVRGTVTDPTGASIPNAAVKLTNSGTGVELKAFSNEAGLYVFPAVPAGSYGIVVEFEGMGKWENTLMVRVQVSQTVDVVLRPATVQTQVEVQDVTPVVVTDTASLGATLERRRIEQLPINGRNVMNLLTTIPGIAFDSGGNIRTYGVRVGTHDVSLDGAALTDTLDGGGTVRRPPGLDTIQEFRVEVNNVSAKFARQSNIIMTTKNGTNELHGTLFETARNNGMAFARTRQDFSTTAPKYIRNEYGGTAGGPVVIPKLYRGKNRTFWFGGYEGFKQRSGATGGYRVPTQAMRNGDFRGLVDSAGTPIRIYNPFQTDPVTKLRPQFAYGGQVNVIDPALQSPLAKYIYSVLPLPNRPEVNPLVANNWFGPNPNIYDQWTFTGRFDHKLTDKDQIYVRLTKSESDNVRQSGYVPTLDRAGNFRRDYFPNKSIAVNWTRSFSATFFNEALFSASREYGAITSGEPGVRYATLLGLPNPNNQEGFPVMNNIGVGTGSPNYFQPQSNRIRYFNWFIFDDNATKVVGRHELQFGVHLRYDQLTYLPQQQQAGGSVSFPAIATALYDPAVPNRTRGVLNTGHVAASAYLGLANYTYRLVKGKYYMRNYEHAFYFQDNYRVTPRLKLNLGLRWQFTPFPRDKYNIITSFNPRDRAVVLGRDLDFLYKMGAATPAQVKLLQDAGVKFQTAEQAGLPYRLVDNNYLDIGPHVGLAYRAFEGGRSFIIRGGFSTSYFSMPLAFWNDRMRLNLPFTGVYQNQDLTSSVNSPDRLPNYGLVSVPTIIAGRNSSDAISLTNPNALQVGSDSFQAAYWAPHQPTSRVHDWNLTVEKELLKNTVLRLAYVGNHSAYQETLDDYNQQMSDYVWYVTRREQLPTGPRAQALRRPWSDSPYGDLQEFRRDGWGNANGAQIEFERRYTSGWGFQFFYVMMNSLRAGGNGYNVAVPPVSSYLPGSVPTDRVERLRLLYYSRDTSVPKHEFRWNWVADLPFGKGRKWMGGANRWMDALVGGWQLTGMGRRWSNYMTLPTNIWPTGEPVRYYGHQYPVQDCRSGSCITGYLLWNGYIPAHQINKPNGIMGVPADYKPAAAPLWPFPADYPSRNAQNDPNYGYYGSNTVFIQLKDGTRQEVGFAPLHPWINQFLPSTWLWMTDASLSKTFAITEGFRVRFQADFFNVFNVPGNAYDGGSMGFASTQFSQNSPRQLQLTARMSW